MKASAIQYCQDLIIRQPRLGSCRSLYFPALCYRATDRLLAAALGAAENGSASSSLEMASVIPPRYVDFKEQIRTEMFTIKQRMNDLRHMHGKAALTNFDDTDSNEAEIEVITQEITRLFRKCEARLQQFTAGQPGSEADEKVFGSAYYPMPTLECWAVIR